MKLDSPYMYATQTEPLEWIIYNKRARTPLGRVVWYPRWNRFVFQPVPAEVIFSDDCLIALAEFCRGLGKEMKGEER